MSQQGQTFDYFKSHANDWQRKANDAEYSVIDNRHRAVLETLKGYPKGSSLLDVGCGTGQLAIEASQLGWKALGVDFAQEMIDICANNNKAAKTDAKFKCASIFDFQVDPNSYDVVSAQGFIEYISLEQLDSFLDFVFHSLKPGGAIALGSRNRIFNLHALNSFTELEGALGTIDKLILEARILQSVANVSDALAQLAALNFIYDQPEKHPLTGIKVDTRYQFSPADLITRLAKHKLKATAIYPVHYHPLPVSVMESEEGMKLHNQFAKFASEQMIRKHQLIPYSSSFVIEAKKA